MKKNKGERYMICELLSVYYTLCSIDDYNMYIETKQSKRFIIHHGACDVETWP